MKTRHVLTLVAAGGLVLTPLGLVPPASAAGTASFYVSVGEYGTSKPVPGTQVTLYNTATGTAVATQTVADTNDPVTPWPDTTVVQFAGLDAGTYTAKAHDPAGKHADKYTRVRTVGDGGFAYDDLDLVPTTIEMGLLSGTVVQADEDLSARIEVYPASATQASIESGDVHPVASTTTYGYSYDQDASADWSVRVPGGQAYKVLVGDRDGEDCDWDYSAGTTVCTFDSSVWVGPAGATATNATSLSVAKAQTLSVANVRLPGDDVGGEDRVTGTVTGGSGVKLDDVEVDLLKEYEHDGQKVWREVASDSTGDDGTFGFDDAREWTWHEDSDPTDDYDDGYWDHAYASTPLTAGTYTVRFSDYEGEYTTKFLGNVGIDPDHPYDVPASAATLTLGTTGAVTADIALTKGTISNTSGAYGVLTDDLGKAHRGYLRFVDPLGNQVLTVNTRRDGSWSAPATTLAPGQYKVQAQGDGLVSGWYGGKTFSSAKVVTVPVKGTANVGGSALRRYATVSGSIAMAAPSGYVKGSEVTVYLANGREWGSTNTRNGAYSLTLPPGTYYLSADGDAWSPFDDSNVGASTIDFIEQFWKGAYTARTATPIVVGSGAKVTGVNMNLGNKLLATATPRISGTPKIGSTLRASAGSWNVTDDVAFSYTWKRGSTVVGRAASYKATKADAGKTLTVTVTATDTTATYGAGASTSPAVKVPKPAKPKKPKKVRHH